MRIGTHNLLFILAIATLWAPQLSAADEPQSQPTTLPEFRMLAEEVDVLQIVEDLKLTEKQVAYIADRAAALAEKRKEFQKQEEAILKELEPYLRKQKDALAAGQEVPSSVESVTSAKLKVMQNNRQQAWKEYQSTVSACIQLLDEGQLRKIKRSPKAVSRATQMVQQIRSASQENWPKLRDQFTAELLEVKKIDKQQEWQTESEDLKTLTGDEKDKAVKDFEQRKEAEIAQMQTDIVQLLESIRTADSRILSIGVNNLASALRSDLDVGFQLTAMMGRILDSPGAESALKARLEKMKSASEKPAPNP